MRQWQKTLNRKNATTIENTHRFLSQPCWLASAASASCRRKTNCPPRSPASEVEVHRHRPQSSMGVEPLPDVNSSSPERSGALRHGARGDDYLRQFSGVPEITVARQVRTCSDVADGPLISQKARHNLHQLHNRSADGWHRYRPRPRLFGKRNRLCPMSEEIFRMTGLLPELAGHRSRIAVCTGRKPLFFRHRRPRQSERRARTVAMHAGGRAQELTPNGALPQDNSLLRRCGLAVVWSKATVNPQGLDI